MKSLTKLFAAGAVLSASSILASATPISTGQTVVATPIDISPTNIVAQVQGNLVAGTFTGQYAEYVITDASNIYNAQCGAAGCLTFVLLVTNDATSTNGIEHVSNGDGGPPFGSVAPGDGFQYYSLNVGYYPIGGTVPLTVDESLYGTVEFNFTGADAIAPGTFSDYMVIETNASNYTEGNFSAIDSSTSTVQGFVPAATTPEPTGIALLGTGLLGIVGVVRKRVA